MIPGLNNIITTYNPNRTLVFNSYEVVFQQDGTPATMFLNKKFPIKK